MNHEDNEPPDIARRGIADDDVEAHRIKLIRATDDDVEETDVEGHRIKFIRVTDDAADEDVEAHRKIL